ncbi:molybdopterin-dependent oxidoreductase [Burkholderia sp. FERM BP-3421]|uniref:molybdopterin-dependent oxidoreductase n=1 Tax=Burkholderia sp. FERM BP-3421 TaxID=1494466 RepID=UPI00235F66D9|nr:molybdopterin-dependent oxidoreductase [Burkholderia sp. FERM BP-3421]WDD95329.1 molybdopterin-dependent oxidoreductase [Burkholderia sp. FERM BP-3421]
MKRIVRACAVLALSQAALAAHAFDLTVAGKISRYTDAEQAVYRFAQADLLAMPVRRITTSTAWTGREVFEGVGLADLVNRVGGTGTTLEVRALDGYMVDIPVEDARKYGVLLAYKADGKFLSLENFGPLFMVYPRDQGGDELKGPLYNSRFIWQINRITIK